MLKSQSTPNSINIRYYNGANGPTIRIGLSSLAQLQHLRLLFAQVMGGSVVILRASEDLLLDGLDGITLRVTSEYDSGIEGLWRVKTTEVLPRFVWRQDALGWQMSIELLEGMEERPSHQYLTDTDISAAIVKVSYLEQSV